MSGGTEARGANTHFFYVVGGHLANVLRELVVCRKLAGGEHVMSLIESHMGRLLEVKERVEGSGTLCGGELLLGGALAGELLQAGPRRANRRLRVRAVARDVDADEARVRVRQVDRCRAHWPLVGGLLDGRRNN